jgi:hypothetical protein
MQHVFEDVMANGPAAFSKYWDDQELMLKVRTEDNGVCPWPSTARAAHDELAQVYHKRRLAHILACCAAHPHACTDRGQDAQHECE